MNPGAIVDEYYRRIDSNDLDWVVSLFSEHATYVRADSRLQGKAEIDRFFRTRRRISGKHVIESIVAVRDQVFCKGEFIGRGETGDRRQVRFFDVWHFHPSGKVRLRETYLALGHEYVKS